MTDRIEKIVSLEWAMFVAVNEGSDPASCQEDRVTFDAMRKAQFEAWSPQAQSSYLEDLEEAQKTNRNLVEEKYIHMMKTTEPSRYDALLVRVKMPTEKASTMAREISDRLLEQTRILFEEYPYVSGHGRPLYSTFDYGDTSIETYQLSELLTYSENTLTALGEHISALEENKVPLARKILENTVRYYGYDSLESAETATKARADEIGFEISFGCACEDECYE